MVLRSLAEVESLGHGWPDEQGQRQRTGHHCRGNPSRPVYASHVLHPSTFRASMQCVKVLVSVEVRH
jgi:hypothetical protein